MKSHHFFYYLFFIISLTSSFSTNGDNTFISLRRILHQPLFPDSSSPPPYDTSSFPPPLLPPPTPPDGSGFDPDQPFFPEGGTPTTTTPYQTPPPPPIPSLGVSNGVGPSPKPTATPTKPTKKVALAISVAIVTLGMLSALAFYLYKHRVKNPAETQKLVPNGGNITDSGPNNSRTYADESRPPQPPSNFLYIGTVEPSNQRSVLVNEDSTANGSPYHKLNTSNNIDNNVNHMKRSDRYRPSPDLQPLPPLTRAPARAVPVQVPVLMPQRNSSPTATFSSSDDEKSDNLFYTPHGSMHSSVGSGDDGYWTQAPRSSSGRINGGYKGGEINGGNYFPYSRRTSPRSRGLASSSPDVIKHAIIPSIKATPPPPPPPPPLPRQVDAEANDIKEYSCEELEKIEIRSNLPKRAKVAAPPPPPNLALLRSISSTSPSHTSSKPHPPPPPPPPPPRGLVSVPQKRYNRVENGTPVVSKVSPQKLQVESCNPRDGPRKESVKTDDYDEFDNGCSSSGRRNGDDLDERRPKLKPLHWDKVKATSDRATVWDQLKSSSFQLNEDMMESLFGCNSTTTVTKESTRKSVLPPVEKENRVLDPKKSQNIAILLRALNVTRDEVAEGLIDGNLEGLGAELFETLVKMAPTKEEEIKLKDYNGDLSKLGAAERFLKGILDIPFAFKRVEAMLYRANFDAEVKYLTKSFETLEVASEELKNSRLFLKLLEAVLQTGNRMNAGTNRGDVKAFKLDTLLKLVDIKGTDGKTTLLHFVVQEIIRSEGIDPDVNSQTLDQLSSTKKEEEFRKQGLQIVSGLSRELGSVKSAAGMDSDVLSSYVSKLESGLEKVKLVLQLEKPDMQGRFFESMKIFLKEATDQIARVKAHERKALAHVREVTQYFHGDTTKEEAHPFRIFLIVRDFLSILDNVCKEVGTMESRSIMGTARSFRISAYASLPVLTKYNVRRDDSSGDEGMSS